MEFYLILLFAMASSFIAGAISIYFYLRNKVPGDIVEKINKLEASHLKMMKDITALWNKYRRLYGMLKKKRFEYVDELINSSLLKESNEKMKDELLKEIRCN